MIAIVAKCQVLILIQTLVLTTARLQIRVAPDGSQFWIDVGGEEWLKMAPTFLRANNTSLIHKIPPAKDGGLTLSNFTANLSGSDPVLGRYTEHQWLYSAFDGHATVRFRASVREFWSTPTLLFTQTFPDGVKNFGFGKDIDLSMSREPNWGTPGTGWPSLQPRHGGLDVSFVTFLGDGSAEFGKGLGSAHLAVERGAAVGYFNGSGYTLVLSSASSFLSSVISGDGKQVRCGVQGAAWNIPPGYSTSFVLHAGAGIGATFMGWGDTLLDMYGKARATPEASVSLQYLGFSTTAAYFYAHRRNETYEETLLAVREFAERVGLPYRWMLIDSFWFVYCFVYILRFVYALTKYLNMLSDIYFLCIYKLSVFLCECASLRFTRYPLLVLDW